MKQNNHAEDYKRQLAFEKSISATPGLHTQKWFSIGSEIGEYSDNIVVVKCDTKERAALIVKAVNERQALLDSHRELLEALRGIIKERLIYSETSEEAIGKSLTAINNAKNI